MVKRKKSYIFAFLLRRLDGMPGEPGIEGPPGMPGQQGPAGDKGDNGKALNDG